MLSIGIDNGISGAIAFNAGDGRITCAATPTLPHKKGGTVYDPHAMAVLVTKHARSAEGEIQALIETPSAMPRVSQGANGNVERHQMGTVSALRLGGCSGCWEGILATLGIPYDFVTPQAWQKVMLAGKPRGRDECKASAIQTCSRLFPGVSLLRTPKCSKPHSGMAEACLISAYARKGGPP